MSSYGIEPVRKRRKTRKGTRSCWECKRRKVKCTYASPTDDVCIGCDRRCMECISQDLPEQAAEPSSRSRLVGDRIGRLETMVQQLAEQVARCPAASTACHGQHVCASNSSDLPIASKLTSNKASREQFIQHEPPQPPSIFSPDCLTHATSASVLPMAGEKQSALSRKLLTSYPSPADIRIIAKINENLALYLHQAFVAPFHILESCVAVESERLWVQHTAETHPILIAQQMLVIASILQHASPAGHRQLIELSRPPQVLARQLAEAATTLVTAHNKFMDSLEGLECLWLEAMYHEHNGSLRQSWLACRRAISTAQLMGLHRRRCPTAKSTLPYRETDVQQIWRHLLQTEGALCFVLETPSFSLDTSKCVDPATAEDTDTSKLERRHAAIASQLLERSERDPDFEDIESTHQIHLELEEATAAMPRRWWLTPSLTDVRDEKDLFLAMLKVRAQIFHSYLLLHAHLPSMLQACGEPADWYCHSHLLSRNICVEASRGLLRRFVKLRSCSRTASYFRLLDRYVWIAAATLLLTRLDGHQTSRDRDHQHIADCAIVSQAMRLIGDDGDEEISNTQITGVIHRLLAMEAARATVVMTYHTPGACSESPGLADDLVKKRDTLVLLIPFVGLVSIALQTQHESVAEDYSPSRTMESPKDLDDEILHSDGETSLVRAINMRRVAPWKMLPYMLRPN